MKRFHQIAIVVIALAMGLCAVRDLYSFDIDREPDWQGSARIIDGDTFIVGEQRIRLFGIDAPEFDDEPSGRLAKVYLSSLIANNQVQCYDTGQRSYNRAVARCFDQNGYEISSTMVAHGYAFDVPAFSNGAFLPSQIAAQLGSKGLHGLNKPQTGVE